MKTHFEPLMNKKIKKFEADAINQNVRSISKNKVCKVLNPIKIGEAVGPDCIPAGTLKEVFGKYGGEVPIKIA